MKQFAFLIILLRLWKNIAQNFNPLVLAESPYIHGLWYFYLTRLMAIASTGMILKHYALSPAQLYYICS